MRLRLSRTHFPVTALGPGIRLGVWVQGCPLACAGCMSLDTWDPHAGSSVEVDELAERWHEAVAAGAQGITVTGGEPLAQPLAVRELVGHVDRTRHDVLMYTGLEPHEFSDAQRVTASLADVLVTGRFDAARPTDLIWRGSANQQLVLQSDLGVHRYTRYVDHIPERPPLQVQADGHGVWLVGTPRRGTLPRLERQLRTQGLDLSGVTWRPAQRP